MGENETGQISAHAAKIYDEFYIPGLFAQWPPRVIDAARIVTGQRVLDVACGTGVLAQAVADRVGTSGSTIGVDINEGVLDIARDKHPAVEWHKGQAEALPLEDNSVDAVVCQFGLMYFEDQQLALQEMMRVLKPGGNLAIVVWDKLENSPGYDIEEQLFLRVLGDEYADDSPYCLGDKKKLAQLFAGAGIPDAHIQTHVGTARFASIEEWIYTDVNGWTIDDAVEGEDYDRLLREAKKDLERFLTPEGTVAFATPAHIVTASK
jgi:SAM-dependent methyltransferase